jgi:hypothetical protein
VNPPTATSASLAPAQEARIGRPGTVSRFLAWTDGLPGHGWWVFPALAVLLFAWAHAILWASGRSPFGVVEPVIAVGVVYGPFLLAILAGANFVSKRSLVTFWPATGWPEADRAGWAAAFVDTPGPWGWVSLVIGVPLAIGSFLSAPAGLLGEGSDRFVLLVAYLPALILGYSMAPAAFVHTLRQLRLVARIHREATAIDPFDRGPVYAFSRLTVLTGLGYVLVGYYSLTVNGAFTAGNVLAVGALVVSLIVGIATFVVPLWGIHERLVDEKATLVRGVEDRIGRISTEMYRRIDAGEFDGTKVVSDALAAVASLRERIQHLPTWPWPPQLLRGFVSALILPLVIYVLTRLVSTQFG